jgi:hypothetical protein
MMNDVTNYEFALLMQNSFDKIEETAPLLLDTPIWIVLKLQMQELLHRLSTEVILVDDSSNDSLQKFVDNYKVKI